MAGQYKHSDGKHYTFPETSPTKPIDDLSHVGAAKEPDNPFDDNWKQQIAWQKDELERLDRANKVRETEQENQQLMDRHGYAPGQMHFKVGDSVESLVDIDNIRKGDAGIVMGACASSHRAYGDKGDKTWNERVWIKFDTTHGIVKFLVKKNDLKLKMKTNERTDLEFRNPYFV